MALCDNQSAPEFTHAPCTPDSDTNIFDGTDPAGADYIGKHPGTAFLEVQFYPPGLGSLAAGRQLRRRPSGARRWRSSACSRTRTPAQLNNIDCRQRAGDEPANFAFITKSGVPHAPPAPLTQTAGHVHPELGDRPVHGLGRPAHGGHPRRGGRLWSVTIHDLTTGGTGSMTASAANGFAQVNFEPTAAACSQSPLHLPAHVRHLERAHPGAVGGAQLQRRLLGRDRPLRVLLGRRPEKAETALSNNEDALDDDDTGCFSAAFSLFVPIGGCIATDDDFDGTSYQPVWPGTDPNRGQDKKYHPSPITFTSPLFNGSAELQPRRLRDRPAPDRGAGLRRDLQPVHG